MVGQGPASGRNGERSRPPGKEPTIIASTRPDPEDDLFRANTDTPAEPAPRLDLTGRPTPIPKPRPARDEDATPDPDEPPPTGRPPETAQPSGPAQPSAAGQPADVGQPTGAWRAPPAPVDRVGPTDRAAWPPQSPMRTTMPLPRPAQASDRPSGLRAIALAGVLLAGGLGLAGVLALGGSGGPARSSPVATAPMAGQVTGEVAVQPADNGTPVDLPGPRSLDWIALGADGTGSMVRADVDAEPLEFRAADTRPGLDGPFDVSWSDARRAGDGSSTGQLGIAPGGRVELLVRSQPTDTRLVLQVSGDEVVVTARTGDGEEIGTARTEGATVVSVVLPADTAATVTVESGGAEIVGIAAAELIGE